VGKLENKYESKDRRLAQFVPTVDEEKEEEIEYYQRRKAFSGFGGKLRGFGFTRDAHAMATSIENFPTKEGVLKKTFQGRPIDLHMLEDYLVWKTSPLAIKTILRYGHAKTIEDVRGLLGTSERARGNPKMLMMVVLAIILLIGGLVFILYGPQMMNMFKP